MPIKISEFLSGGEALVGDLFAAIRTVNGVQNDYKINFPGTGVKDSAGNYMLRWFPGTGVNTNYIQVTSASSGNDPLLQVGGGDTNINFGIGAFGTGHVYFTGTGAVGVPVGTTAQEPTGFAGGLRYDTDTDFLRYWDVGLGMWVDIIAGAAYDDATFVTNTDETANLPNSQPLSALVSGFMFVTNGTGIITSSAIPLGATLGGTSQSTYILGDTLYSSAANTLSKLAGNTTAVKQYLSQTGTGAVSAAPVWSTISGTDITGQALTKTDDTNVTLTLAGTPATALLRATSLTLGWTGLLGGVRGGTGVNNGASTITVGGNTAFSGAFTFTGTLTGNTGVTFPTSGTLATTGQLPTPAALTKTDDTNVTLTLGGTPTTALLQATSLTLGWTGLLALARGGSNAALTASNGGIVYSTASALAVLAATATARQMLQSGANAAPAWSTATYPATTTINQLLYSSANNTIGGLATVNGAVMVTTNGGVPGFSSTMTNGQLIIGSTGATPVAANLTAGSGVTITNSAGGITISTAGAGGGPQFWIVYNTVTTTSIIGSFNVTSLTDNGVGDTTVTYTVPFANTNYTVTSGSTFTGGGGFCFVEVWGNGAGPIAPVVGSIGIATVNTVTIALVDCGRVCLAGFGPQQDYINEKFSFY